MHRRGCQGWEVCQKGAGGGFFARGKAGLNVIVSIPLGFVAQISRRLNFESPRLL